MEARRPPPQGYGHGHGHGRGRGGRGRGGNRHGQQQHGQSKRGFRHPSGAGGASGRGSFWFKGEGYNDQEGVSIDEEVVGIHGFLNGAQRGFPGLVKQRYSDFVVHEVARPGQVVALTEVVRKKKTLNANFMELVTAFAFSQTEEEPTTAAEADGHTTTAGTATAAAVAAAEPSVAHVECVKLVRELARGLTLRSNEISKEGQRILASYNVGKLVAHVRAELGDQMSGEFARFLARVQEQQQQKQIQMERTGQEAAPESDLVFYIGGLNEKAERVHLHETMRRFGKTVIVADTITSPDQSQVIRIRPVTSGAPRKGERDGRRDWPVDRPDYLQFVVYKCNKDIMTVMHQIAAVLKVNVSLFSFADAKDKRGITSQLCTAYHVTKDRFQLFLRMLSRGLDEQKFIVGNLKYVARKITAGDCWGNAFSMVVRGIPEAKTLPNADIAEMVQIWQNQGFINFFGLQRFGSNATPFHLIGRAVLRRDFKMAVLLLLRPQDGEASKIREAREHFRQHKDVAAALRMLPPFLVSERAVLEGLQQHGIDASELAFRNIPAHLRIAYVESYQNYAWNQMASLRMQMSGGGARVLEGDLVLERRPQTKTNNQSESTATEEEESEDDATRRVIIVSADELAKYTIDDVVLPLPGYQVIYPNNEVGTALQKMLTVDGVDLAAWAKTTQSANHHPYLLAGSYRRVIRRPTNVSYEIKEGVEATQALILTDVDRLLKRGTPLTAAAPQLDAEDERGPQNTPPSTAAAGSTPGNTKDGRALVLHFHLPYGSDATMAVRELLKQNSSIRVQWQLSEKHNGSAASTSKYLQKSGIAEAANGRKASMKNGGVAVSGKKRASSGAEFDVGNAKAAKKPQVAIGRPGFSLGKS